MPTLPFDHGWLPAHSTALTTSADSPGPAQSRHPGRPAEAADVDLDPGVAALHELAADDEVVEPLVRPFGRPDGS